MSGPVIREGEHLALVDLLDRLLVGGVAISGDVTLSIAGVDLVYLGLRLVLTSSGNLSEEARAALGLSAQEAS